MKSKSTFDNDTVYKIEEQVGVATPMSSDDIRIVQTTPGSFQRHQDRPNDIHVAKVPPMSLSSSEINSETKFQTPKISKTYIDFKESLSEGEGESFLNFVKEAIKNLNQPVNDLEAWLASKTKAGQNRWEVLLPEIPGGK
jgi:hypothetical protein